MFFGGGFSRCRHRRRMLKLSMKYREENTYETHLRLKIGTVW